MTTHVTNEIAARALDDISRNDGVMWEPETGYHAKILWDYLEANGLIYREPWSVKHRPSALGRDLQRSRRMRK